MLQQNKETVAARFNHVPQGVLWLILLTIYVAAGKFGLNLAFVNESASAVWPPTGIALAAILLLGYRVWPVIFLGAFLVNFSTTGTIFSSLGIALGNTLEGLIGGYLVGRYASGERAFENVNNIFSFIAFAAILSTAVAATIGVLSLTVFGHAEWSSVGPIWLTWWLGDAVGAVTVAPILLMWASPRYQKSAFRRAGEVTAFLAGLIVVNLIVFTDVIPSLNNRAIGYFLIPFLVWPAVRFSQKETTVAILITSGVAIWGTLRGWGPFGDYPQNEALLLLQSYVAVMSLTSWVLGAIVAENTKTKKKLSHAYDTALVGWSKALDIRDHETEGHTQRVASLTVELARALGMGEKDLIEIRRGALLHDIGKISIPDTILSKPGPLTKEEWTIMREHPQHAYEFLRNTSLEDAAEIPYAHHEKWDGTGYPQGLKGEEIPLYARIFAVVDVWDAMCSDRPYRQAEGNSQVLAHLASLSGTHFDPKIVDVFVKLMKEREKNAEPKEFSKGIAQAS